MQRSGQLLKPQEAATALGISYATLKQWILKGKLKTVKTAGGHHRIPVSALDPFLASPPQPAAVARPAGRTISGRNQLIGCVLDVQIEGLLAKVVLSVGGQTITAIITADSVRELGLKPGDTAMALIKATEVMIGLP